MRRWMIIISFVMLLVMPISVSAADSEVDQIEKYMEDALEKYNIPGASLAVVKEGKVIFQDSWGKQSDDTEVTDQSLFLLGSLSKPLTSLGIMRMVENGQIELDVPIKMYIPEFISERSHLEDITVRQLLSHTSGFSGYAGLEVADQNVRGENAIQKVLEKIDDFSLISSPGETYEYSATNYLLLGYIIASVSGQSFPDYMEAEVFQELNMERTVSTYEKAVELGYQNGYQSWFGKPVKSEVIYDNSGAPYGYMASSAQDLANFVAFLLNEGDGVLSEEMFEEYAAPQVERGEDAFYGLGWFISTKKNDPYYFHSGSTPTSLAQLLVDEQDDFGFVLLTNKHNISEVLHTTYMREGIKQILEGEGVPQLPDSNYSMQWITLGTSVVLSLLVLWSLFLLIRKKVVRTKLWGGTGLFSFIMAFILIPVLTKIFHAPWYTMKVTAPDIAFFIQWTVGVLLVYGVSVLIVTFRKIR
ncbi:CubicO group peptidase, beta-lactamase class C family [Gracilibacillus ureilyticus]|uniref:CubicO group peptidase, beta-lactamase class C family n=1 Tax=Gracilibacillus ureilyticus TaxID=531814 RepID=A0A1H9U101_9BACI|nr:serine hydrolase domain-containing protein [Gracilibacillus ureilyticus]SES02948.1 CubicO group peptidase, beta-lactamase class C family [Gracilibacillus ureilyticus]